MRDELYMSDREAWRWGCVFMIVATVGLWIAILAGCTSAQRAVAADYQAKVAGACGVAMTLAPLAGPVAPWIIGGCATEAAIAKLALDPTSLAWVEGLVAKAKGAA